MIHLLMNNLENRDNIYTFANEMAIVPQNV